jgi:ABC-type dipeptide/oligopeptide/nickel transport system permease subunit
VLKNLLRHKYFLTGAIICGGFLLLSVLGYGITLDATPQANRLMPEWAQLKPGSQKKGVYLKRKADRSFWYWLHGDEGAGEVWSVLGEVTVGKDSISFVYEKTGMPMQVAKSDLESVEPTSFRFLLGTDNFGRDILSRLIIGARISLSIGFLAMLLSLVIGIGIGLSAGYFGGRVDAVLSWLITVFWSIPTLLLALGLSVFMGKGYYQVLIATGLSTWVEVARIVRGQTLQLKNQEFILFAKITGFSNTRILLKHILPNLTGSLTVLATTNFASAILLEAGLGFLGLGVAPPTASWGIMVKENLGYLVLDQAYLAIIPGLAIMILVMAFNLMSMGIREVLE